MNIGIISKSDKLGAGASWIADNLIKLLNNWSHIVHHYYQIFCWRRVITSKFEINIIENNEIVERIKLYYKMQKKSFIARVVSIISKIIIGKNVI